MAHSEGTRYVENADCWWCPKQKNLPRTKIYGLSRVLGCKEAGATKWPRVGPPPQKVDTPGLLRVYDSAPEAQVSELANASTTRA